MMYCRGQSFPLRSSWKECRTQETVLSIVSKMTNQGPLKWPLQERPGESEGAGSMHIIWETNKYPGLKEE